MMAWQRHACIRRAHCCTGRKPEGGMKNVALPAILSLSCRGAGAFTGFHAAPSGSVRHSTSRTNLFDDTLSSQQERRCSTSPVPANRGTTRRRYLSRAPRVRLMSSGNADSAESPEAADGANEEEISIQEGTSLPGAGSSHDEGDGENSTGVEAVVEAAGAGVTASSEGGEGGLQSEEAAESVTADEQKGETQEEEEDDGETVFLPSGDIKDFRLFRAKLRAGSDEKWREQLKRNVNAAQLGGQDAWAHELSAPEKGCLIVAKSSEFSLTQTYFNEAVIFLASHDEAGSAGFILNRPTSVSLGDLVEGDALPQFRGTPLYLGGDVGEGNVQILHPYGPDQLAGSMEIIPGVYIGGAVDEADRMVASGKAKVDDFRFFLHLCGWAPGQLEAEIERGVWFPAATSTNIIMKHCLGLPVPMWREVMTLMGPKFGLLARDTYDDL